MKIPVVEWENIADDDFVYSYNKYMLRVEQMNKHHWWWCVYRDEGKKGLKYVAFDDPHACTELEAKLLAELAFVKDIIKPKKIP